MTPETIREALRQVRYPGYSRDIVSFGLVRSASFADGTARVSLAPTASDPQVRAEIKAGVERLLLALPGVKAADVDFGAGQARAQAAAGPGGGAAAGIKHAVAIASGKGGVGKSTFAVNLACALAQELAARGMPGGRVGLMDCDVHGPTVPLMMGLSGRPEIEGEGENAMLLPMEKHGVSVMSMGFLIDPDTPVIWRGPLIMKAVQQFVQNVRWGDIEVLLVDLPPGTGDAQLTLVQTLRVDGAILVTTPQVAATNVAHRGGLMFRKVDVPIVGVVENMSYFTDPAGRRHELFGAGGGSRLAADLGTAFLGQVPLLNEIREGGDAGRPVVVSAPAGDAARFFRQIALGLLGRLEPAGR